MQHMDLLIINYPLQYSKRLVAQLQGKRQCRCVVWIINCALPIHWHPRVLLGANKLVSEHWTKRITEGYRGYMEFDIAFVSWVKVLLDLFKLSKFLSLDPVFPKKKIIYFWFKTMKNDWVWRKCFERYITILSVSVDIIGALFFQLVSLLEKLDSKFESFFTE